MQNNKNPPNILHAAAMGLFFYAGGFTNAYVVGGKIKGDNSAGGFVDYNGEKTVYFIGAAIIKRPAFSKIIRLRA
ncbi:MAG: hypothetical protein E7056_01835 [Lentisphaerae bacterium]|nr:hypothetical protein [Lentisphaerota bacterium]